MIWRVLFLWLLGSIGGLLARTDTNGSTYYHADGAGNITALINGDQSIVAPYLYNPFGKLTGQWGMLANANEMRFSSMPWDNVAGLALYPARAYEPNFQRWLNRDPIQEAGGNNLYRMVGNNPMNGIDPLGNSILGTIGNWWNAAGAALASPVGDLEAAAAEVNGTLSMNAQLSANGYAGLQDFNLNGPNSKNNGTPTAGDLEPIHAAGCMLKAAVSDLATALPMLASGGLAAPAEGLAGGLTAGADTAAANSGLVLNNAGGGTALPMSIVRTVGDDGLTPEIVNELKSLTFDTGNEHAVVTLSTGENAIVSGGPGGITFEEGQITGILGHTHPYDAISGGFPSLGDMQALQLLNQESSVIFWRGQIINFGPEGSF